MKISTRRWPISTVWWKTWTLSSRMASSLAEWPTGGPFLVHSVNRHCDLRLVLHLRETALSQENLEMHRMGSTLTGTHFDNNWLLVGSSQMRSIDSHYSLSPPSSPFTPTYSFFPTFTCSCTVTRFFPSCVSSSTSLWRICFFRLIYPCPLRCLYILPMLNCFSANFSTEYSDLFFVFSFPLHSLLS